MIINNFQKKMAMKAIKQGINENFGQKELQELKNKYGYNPYGDTVERENAQNIDFLDNWLSCFDYNQLENWNF